MAKLRAEGDAFDPLQGAPVDPQSGGDAATLPASDPAQQLAGELGGLDGFFALIEHLPAVVMVANADLELVFANQAAHAMLQRIDADLRQAFGIGADEVVGSSIHRFHRAPEAVDQVLHGLESSGHHAALRFGDVVITSTINRLDDAGGALMGYAVNWRDVSELDRAQNDMARITNMVENSPTNLMMADTDLNITYINPSMRRSFERIREHLPVSPDAIVDTSLDVFHSSPQHQRAILGDPANLPHEANFAIGDEQVRLLVNAIYDKDGHFIGPMATWEFVTEQLRLENERQAALDRELEQAEDLRRGIDAVLQAVQAAADGDLGGRVETQAEGAVSQIGGALDRFFAELRQQIVVITRTSRDMAKASETLTTSSQQMGASAEETSAQANTVSSSARSVSDSLQTIAAAIEQMTSSIGEISTNTTKAAQMAQEAVSVTETTNGIIAKLGERSSEIGNVTKQITSIAEQTNLLALNATIEAARAGEAGKGFAVVANEVKELARETGDATEDIGTKIEAIQAEIDNAVDGISKVSGIIRQINDIQVIVASAVEQQTSTSGEMSRNIGDAATGSLNISNNIEGVAEAAQNAAGGAHDTQTAAAGLSRMSVELQELVSHFKVDEGTGGQSEDGEDVDQLITALEEAGYARADILKALEESAE